jgi:hypothetical protein
MNKFEEPDQRMNLKLVYFGPALSGKGVRHWLITMTDKHSAMLSAGKSASRMEMQKRHTSPRW